jgi:hypothetical protein
VANIILGFIFSVYVFGSYWEQIAFDLGYYILPAINALGGDGVPASVVKQCASIAASRERPIVDQCEYARNRLRLGIGHEYTLMKAGDSTILPLIDAVIDLINDTCALAGIQLSRP